MGGLLPTLTVAMPETPSLLVAVTRFYGLLTNAGDTQIIMTIPE